jgi:hypothetical protein
VIGPESGNGQVLRYLAAKWLAERRADTPDEVWTCAAELVETFGWAARSRVSDCGKAGCVIERQSCKHPGRTDKRYRLTFVPADLADAVLADILSPRHRAMLSDPANTGGALVTEDNGQLALAVAS